MSGFGLPRRAVALLLVAATSLALGGAATASCIRAIAAAADAAACDPADDERCIATATADGAGELHVTEHLEQATDVPSTGRACALAWLELRMPASDTAVDLHVSRAEITRADTIDGSGSGSGTGATAIAWASAVAPPASDAVSADTCAADSDFRRDLSWTTIVERAEPGSSLRTDQRFTLHPVVPDDDGDGTVPVYVGILGYAVHDAIGTFDVRIDASLATEVCEPPPPTPVGGVNVVVDPTPIAPAQVTTTTAPANTTDVTAAPSEQRAAAPTLHRVDVGRPADAELSPVGQVRLADLDGSDGGSPALVVLVAVALAGGVALAALARWRTRAVVAAAAGSAPAPVAPAPAARRSLWSRLDTAAKGLTTLVGVVTGIAVLVFLYRPNLEPTTVNSVSIDEIAVETGVSLAEYTEHPAVASVLERDGRGEELLDLNGSIVDEPGVVVHFSFHAEGYVSKRVVARWTLFDAGTGARLAESEGTDPLPFSFSSEKRDADIGSWESWVRTAGHDGKELFVRMELYDQAKGIRIAFRDTPVFVGPKTAR